MLLFQCKFIQRSNGKKSLIRRFPKQSNTEPTVEGLGESRGGVLTRPAWIKVNHLKKKVNIRSLEVAE